MNKTMDASNFLYTIPFKEQEFQGILKACVEIFKDILLHNRKFLNLENDIRDGFGEYLSDDDFKMKTAPLMNYHYEPEAIENQGRVDMKFIQVNPYEGTRSYFIIECKRIDGSKKLNSEYVKNGISRFVQNFYSSNFGFNGILGFVVNNIDIDNNIVNGINPLLCIDMVNDKNKIVNAQSTKYLIKTIDIDNYKFAYTSEHSCLNTTLKLYHIMFDLSKNITKFKPHAEIAIG